MSHQQPATDLRNLGSPLQGYELFLGINPPLWKHEGPGRQLNECLQIGEALMMDWALSEWSVGIWVGRGDQAAGNRAGIAQKVADFPSYEGFFCCPDRIKNG